MTLDLEGPMPKLVSPLAQLADMLTADKSFPAVAESSK